MFTFKLNSRAITFALAAASIVIAVPAQAANTVTGSIWENQAAASQNAIPGNVPGTPADVTFATVAPINFASGGLYTIGEFLGSGNGSTILTGSSHLGDSLVNTIFDFKGSVSVTNGQQFTAGHDDGLTLIIGGQTVINAPGPTSFVNTTSTYTGPTGNFSFELVYGECCGAPANLSISLPLTSPVPEPATYGMMAAGLGLMGFMVRSKKSA